MTGVIPRRVAVVGSGVAGLTAAHVLGKQTEVTLSDQGWDEITRASGGHIDLVRRLFFEGLPDELLEPLTAGLESVYDNIIEHGTLPAPSDES